MDVLTMSAMVLISVIHIRVCSFSFSNASDLRRSLFKPHSDFSNASNVLCRPKSVTLTTRNLRWPEIRHLRFACAVHFTSLEPLLALHPSVQMATLWRMEWMRRGLGARFRTCRQIFLIRRGSSTPLHLSKSLSKMEITQRALGSTILSNDVHHVSCLGV